MNTENLFKTNYQKVLKYLAENPSEEYVGGDIQTAIRISKAGVNFALRALAEDGLVIRKRKGRMYFYSVDISNPLIRQVKVMITLSKIMPLILKLEKISEKIILFGSSAAGENIETSDIDIFVLSNMPKEAAQTPGKLREKKVQIVPMKPLDYINLEKKDPVFYEEVSRGIILWEKKSE